MQINSTPLKYSRT